MGYFHSPPPVEGEAVVDERPGKPALVDKALSDELLKHLTCLTGGEAPLEELVAHVGWCLLAA